MTPSSAPRASQSPSVYSTASEYPALSPISGHSAAGQIRGRAEKVDKFSGRSVELGKFAFPQCQYAPSKLAEFRRLFPMTLHVAGYLRLPVLGVPDRLPVAALTVMAVPEAAVDEDDLLATREHDVRRSGEVSPVELVAVSHGVQQAPHAEFRLRVP